MTKNICSGPVNNGGICGAEAEYKCDICKKFFCVNCMYTVCDICHKFINCFLVW